MLSGIHLLRGVAALLVAGFHIYAASAGTENGTPFLFSAFRGGALGVDIFFVISGFIIFYSASRSQPWNAGQFMTGRFFRIYPVYWAVLIGYLGLVGGLWLMTGDASRIPELNTLIRSLLLFPSDTYAISIAWTLTIELLFYALFAALFRGAESDNSLVFTAMMSWGFLSILYTVAGIDAGGLNVIFHPAVSELLFGMLLGYIWLKGERRFAVAALILGFSGLAATMTVVPGDALHEWRALQAGVPAALLVYGALSLRLRLGFFGKLLGDASYVLYLIHIPAYMVIGFIAEKVLGISIYANDLTMGVTLLSVVALAALVHLLLERPYQAWYKARTAREQNATRDHRQPIS